MPKNGSSAKNLFIQQKFPSYYCPYMVHVVIHVITQTVSEFNQNNIISNN